MNKKLMIIMAGVFGLTVLGALMVGFATPSLDPSDAQANASKTLINTDEEADVTTKIGVISCLQPLDNDPVRNQSCALGLFTDEGSAYQLSRVNPSLISRYSTGQKVQVEGIIRHQVTGYKTDGVITVYTIKRL